MRKLITTFNAAVFTLLLANTASAENLLDIYKLAETNDAQIRAAQAQYYADAQSVPISRSALLPSINATANQDESSTDDFAKTNFLDPTKKSDGSRWSINLRQSIYDHGTYVALSQAKASRSRAEANYEAARQNLIIRVTEAYLNMLAAMDSLEFAQAEMKSVGQQLQQTKQRFEVGLIAITDVKESQAQYDLAVASEIRARNTLSTRREALFTITNAYPDKIKPLVDAITLSTPDPDNIQSWVESALSGNLSLIAAGFDRDIADKEVSRLRAQHYPSLDIVARKSNTLSENSTTGIATIDRETTTVGLELSIPIFSGGRTHSQVRQALYRHDASRDQYEGQRRITIQQTRDAYQNVIADISRVKALKQALASTQAAYEATNAGYEVGTRNSVEVLVSLRETFRAKRDYSQARYDYILDSLRLKQATGSLTTQDLEAINRWFQ